MSNYSDQHYDHLLESINLKYGVDLPNYAKASIERRIDRFLKLQHVPSVEALAERVINDSLYFDHFIKEITVNTTEMFRDPSCWKELRTRVLPLLSELPTIRIWHAGCSSGEEVCSMAILLKECGLYEKSKIVATDLNKDILQNAKKGQYSIKSFQLNSENHLMSGSSERLNDHFQMQSTSYHIKEELLQNVTFLKHDLSSCNAFSKFDLILCRNVMIYFNKQLQENVFGLFSKSLFKKGFVVIGKKESMAYFSRSNEFEEFSSEEKIYRWR